MVGISLREMHFLSRSERATINTGAPTIGRPTHIAMATHNRPSVDATHAHETALRPSATNFRVARIWPLRILNEKLGGFLLFQLFEGGPAT